MQLNHFVVSFWMYQFLFTSATCHATEIDDANDADDVYDEISVYDTQGSQRVETDEGVDACMGGWLHGWLDGWMDGHGMWDCWLLVIVCCSHAV